MKTLPQVQVVLSGMRSLEQIQDNVATFSDDQPLSQADTELLMEACEKFRSQIQIPCTACRYCCSGCPKEINIPEYLKIYNDYKVTGAWALSRLPGVQSKGTPADCVACGACASHCPQSIQIPELMAELAELAKTAQ